MPSSKSSTDSAKRIELGILGRPRGVQGAILFWPHDPSSEAVYDLDYIYVDDERYELLDARQMNKGIELVLEGVESPEAAKALTHKKVSIERVLMPQLEEGEYYLEDLRGLVVVDEEGVIQGEIIGFTDTGTQTLLDVRVAPGKTVLVPARPEFILRVEPKVHVVVRSIEGLFE